MRAGLRGLQEICTAIKSGRRSRPRTRDRISSELAHLKREKARLTAERGNWEKKVRLIDARLAQITTTEESLEAALEKAETAVAPHAAGRKAGRRRARDDESVDALVVRY